MLCFVMVTLGRGRVVPIMAADGTVRLFEDYADAIEAAEGLTKGGYVVYQNLNKPGREEGIICQQRNGTSKDS